MTREEVKVKDEKRGEGKRREEPRRGGQNKTEQKRVQQARRGDNTFQLICV